MFGNTQKFHSRLDAADSYFLSQQLQSLDPTKFYELFAGRIGRRFLNVIDNVSPYDTVYKYAMIKMRGTAKKGGQHSRDARTVSVTKTETTQNIKNIPVEYGWSVDEISASKAKGLDLDTDELQTAIGTVEQTIDNMLATGDTEIGVTGMLNNANVNITQAVAKTGGGRPWTGSTILPKEVIAEVTGMISRTRSRLKQATDKSTGMPAFPELGLLLPQTAMSYVASTPRSDNSDTTVMSWLLETNPWLKSIEDWWQCDTGDTQHSNGTISVLYPIVPGTVGCHPMAGGALIPVDFVSLAPQERGHDVRIPSKGRCGGTVIRYTFAFEYLYGN